ncbi:MAG: hypothetical protein ACXWL8_03950 [Candidatus Limnocylindria bacterium]
MAISPLFDGIFVEDPYRFVNPPPGASGDPLPAKVTDPVSGGAVPLLALATPEVPPQAQIIAQADAFDVSADVTSIILSITPRAPRDPQVAGNVYTFSAVDQDGTALTIRPSALVTIVLRAPQPNPSMVVARLDGARWATLQTEQSGLPDIVSANVDRLGDYAVVLNNPSTSPSAGGESIGATSSPAPSPGAGQGSAPGLPVWLIILLVVGAIGIGAAWGVFVDTGRR